MCSGNQERTLSTQFKGCVDCRRDAGSEGTAVGREGVSGLNRCMEPAVLGLLPSMSWRHDPSVRHSSSHSRIK